MDAPKAPSNLADADNGFATSLVMSEARIKQDPIGQSIERMLVEVTRFLWHLIAQGPGAGLGGGGGGHRGRGGGAGLALRGAGRPGHGRGRALVALGEERPNAQLVEAATGTSGCGSAPPALAGHRGHGG